MQVRKCQTLTICTSKSTDLAAAEEVTAAAVTATTTALAVQ